MNNITKQYSPAEMELLIRQYTPLVIATARFYKGKGAEFDDLVQEGYLALLRLIPKCRDARWMAAFLKNHLPGYVRAAAARMRWKKNTFALEDGFEDFLPDKGSDDVHSKIELQEILAGVLTEEEIGFAMALSLGCTQKELAEQRSVSQQAINAKVRRIKNKLRPYFVVCG